MSKLEMVRSALKSVVVVEERSTNLLPYYTGEDCVGHKVVFYVAPKVGLYTAKELQAMMVSLVPDLKLDRHSKSDFDEKESGSVYFGALYFSETIGNKTTRWEVEITDSESTLKTNRLADNENDRTWKEESKCGWNKTEMIMRSITVKLFPDVQYAITALLEGDINSVDKKELEKRSRIATRLANLSL